jgi:hypothetical protein
VSKLSFRRRLLVPAAGALAVAAIALVPASAASLPGTTIADNCTSYKSIPDGAEYVGYYKCQDGGTVKGVTYVAKDGEAFTYYEFRDALNNLTGSRFVRADSATAAATSLADSATP